MVRTALFSTFAVAAMAIPVASADAAMPPIVHPQVRGSHDRHLPPVCRTFNVMYRSCAVEPWRCYRTFESSFQADRASHRLRHRGYEVRVVVG